MYKAIQVYPGSQPFLFKHGIRIVLHIQCMSVTSDTVLVETLTLRPAESATTH